MHEELKKNFFLVSEGGCARPPRPMVATPLFGDELSAAEKERSKAEVSIKLSHFMDVVGYNQDIKYLHKSTYKTLDLWSELCSQIGTEGVGSCGEEVRLIVGSTAEGTALLDSDVDTMIFTPYKVHKANDLKLQTDQSGSNNKDSLLMIEEMAVHSGFVPLTTLDHYTRMRDNPGICIPWLSSKLFLLETINKAKISYMAHVQYLSQGTSM
jgi:hypothetical protein